MVTSMLTEIMDIAHQGICTRFSDLEFNVKLTLAIFPKEELEYMLRRGRECS